MLNRLAIAPLSSPFQCISITVSKVFFSCTHNLFGLLGYAFLYATLLLHNFEQYLRRLSRNSPFRLFPQYTQLLFFSSTVYHLVVILTQMACGFNVLMCLTLTQRLKKPFTKCPWGSILVWTFLIASQK